MNSQKVAVELPLVRILKENPNAQFQSPGRPVDPLSLYRDDALVLFSVLDGVDHGDAKYRAMRRSAQRLMDALADVSEAWQADREVGQQETTISVSWEQVEHLGKIIDNPPENVRFQGAVVNRSIVAFEIWLEKEEKRRQETETEAPAESSSAEPPAPASQ